MKNNTTITIPNKYKSMIDEVDHDYDGYWIYLADGFKCPEMDCHTIHEDTQKELLRLMRTITPCDCDSCKEALAKANNLKDGD